VVADVAGTITRVRPDDLMALKIEAIDHVQVTVPASALAAAIRFYGEVLGLKTIDKPESLRKNGGTWYQVGSFELHISPEDEPAGLAQSKRHVCYVVPELDAAQRQLAAHLVEIISDHQPIPGWVRCYIRDPAGNRIEIAQRLR
jgi:catechol 2,3-dioxygenase-like lactoylglutathione lyase family enzyme